MGAIQNEIEREIASKEYGDTNQTYPCRKATIPSSIGNHIQVEQNEEPDANDLSTAEYISNYIGKTLSELKNLLQDDMVVMMKNKRVWLDRKTAALFPKFDAVKLPAFKTEDQPLKKSFHFPLDGFDFVPMTRNECKKSFTENTGNPYLQQDGTFKHFKTEKAKNLIMVNEITTRGKTGCIASDGMFHAFKDSTEITLVPIHRLNGVDSYNIGYGDACVASLENGLVPEGLPVELEESYTFLMNVYNEIKRYVKNSGDKLIFEAKTFLNDAEKGKIDIDFLRAKGLGSEPESSGEKKDPIDRLRQYLCDCDYIRASIKSYDAKRLEDPNSGHWELFERPEPGGEEVALPDGITFWARPPQKDVNDGIVAIDFGTKSTVVVREIGTKDRLMRVGQGNYDKAPEKKDYENPTVIELRDYESFLNAYTKRDGRPFTRWEWARFSHEAANALMDAEDESTAQDSAFYSIFSELKQWANDPERRMKLKDRCGHFVDLKPYTELSGDDFDPIEMYAYYLGLYINNMHNGICLEYMLSFPVTYESAVRERILKSFTRGLKKSLPPAILRDKELMESFDVYAGTSEPAAYASCALGKLGLEPKQGEKTAYAVFDFGGGTTDFDFGVESVPENKRTKFVIEQYSSTGRGDPYLGGENLLNILAYEIYIHPDNIKKMRDNQVPFVIPHGCDGIAGSESILFTTKNAPQEAYINVKRIVEKIRCFWEEPNGEKAVALFDQTQTIPLFSQKLGKAESIEIKFNHDMMEECLKRHIRRGIENFFEALKGAFDGRQDYPIHILLAGNSCKSAIVREIFNEKIEEVQEELRAKVEETAGRDKVLPEIFELHMPLGFEEPKEEEEKGSEEGADSPKDAELAQDFDQMPTGKTGVAFGLLRSRKGGRDVKISGNKEISPFLFYLGHIEDDKFHMDIGMDIPYQQWVPFTFADESSFEVYFTKEARSVYNTMDRADVSRVRCKINENDVIDEDAAHIFVRKISVDTIEFTAARDAEINSGSVTGTVYQKRLS